MLQIQALLRTNNAAASLQQQALGKRLQQG
jgi:hypothetical protein